jgi:internalin A
MQPVQLKPAAILALEKDNNIVFLSSKDTKGQSFYTYNTNKKGDLTSITSDGRQGALSNISALASVTTLVELHLTQQNITDVTPLSASTKLKSVFLGGNKITDISPLANCINLSTLIIWGNPIKDLTPLKSLKNLRGLYCQDIAGQSYDFLKDMSVTHIAVDSCQLETLDRIPTVPSLKMISAASNKISDLSNCMRFENLNTLDLSSNDVKYIPDEVARHYDWLSTSIGQVSRRLREESGLYIQNNPLEYPPESVVESGPETVAKYYKTANEFGYAPLSEGRIIVIGDGSAGKSSLIEQILHSRFEQGKPQTNGIKIENWPLQHKSGRDLMFHIWDFGGQEIQHAVHKFFFTEGCLYILVLDNRKEEEPEYWLQQIESFGGSAPVVVVFNKHDENPIEVADKKFLKVKYPNIVGFYNTSCLTGHGISDLRRDLLCEAVRLRTVDEQFPNNWFSIKKTLSERTSGEQHYIDYEEFKKVCSHNNVDDVITQKLLLKYFTTIGAVTWFGDTYLNFLHVLSPAWITQGVYKIITAKKTAQLLGHISIDYFPELLQPTTDTDYVYDENHYGYILKMMKKFDLCYTSDDKNMLLPSAFQKQPKVEYSDFEGDEVRTYILKFKDYMPMALLHKFIAKKISAAYDSNYWYSGIVIQDDSSDALTMVQADREAKKIYIRIKGESPLGMWEHVRREFIALSKSYANIPYTELVVLDDRHSGDTTISYEDLLGHLKGNRPTYFSPKLQRDFSVGKLMGMFENKEVTVQKIKDGQIPSFKYSGQEEGKVPSFVFNILNQVNTNATATATATATANVSVDIKVINKLGSDVKGDANYLLGEIEKSNKDLKEALLKIIEFAQDAKTSTDASDVKEKGWGRKIKNYAETLAGAGDKLKKVKDGAAAAKAIFTGLQEISSHLDMHEVAHSIGELYEKFQHAL